MGIDIESLLKLHPLNKAIILAGKEGIKKNTVTAFGVLEAPDSYLFCNCNEFLLTTGYIFKVEPDIQLKVIKELHKRGVAALGIKIGRFINEISSEVIEYCDKVGFPIFAIPCQYGWFDMFRPFLYLMYSKTQYENNNILKNMADISKKIINGNNFEDVSSYINTVINRECIIVLNDEKEIYPQNYSEQNRTSIMKDIKTIIDIFYNNKLDFVEKNIKRIIYGDNIIYICEITCMGVCYGHLLVFEGNKEVNRDDIHLIQYIGSCLEYFINKYFEVHNKYTAKHNKLLLEILKASPSNVEELKGRAMELNIDMKTDYLIAVSSNINISQHDNLYKLYRFIETNLNNRYKVLTAFDFNDKFIIFIPIEKEKNEESIYKDARKKLNSIVKELNIYFKTKNISFGVGSIYKGSENISLSYNEAIVAVNTYEKLKLKNYITFYSNLGIYSILNNPQTNKDLQRFIGKYIELINEFDNENNLNLIETLKSYFESGNSYRACAKKMKLHHNTIRYRLNKVEEICNIDLAVEDDILELQLALKLIPFIEN